MHQSTCTHEGGDAGRRCAVSGVPEGGGVGHVRDAPERQRVPALIQ